MKNALKSFSKVKPPDHIGLAGFTDFGHLPCPDSSEIKNLPDQNLLAHLFVRSGSRALTGKVLLKQFNLK